MFGAIIFLVTGPPIATALFPADEWPPPCIPPDCIGQVPIIPAFVVHFDGIPIPLLSELLLLFGVWHLRGEMNLERRKGTGTAFFSERSGSTGTVRISASSSFHSDPRRTGKAQTRGSDQPFEHRA